MDTITRLRPIALALFALIVAGCSGMSVTECQTADWETIGYEDGVVGRSGAAIGNYRRDCADAGVVPDRLAYENGRRAGLTEYCRPANGYRVGLSGAEYQSVCGDFDEFGFLEGYRAGRVIFELRREVNRAAALVDRAQRDIDAQRLAIADIEKALIAAETTPEERVGLLVDLKTASERLGELNGELVNSQRLLAEAEAELRAQERATAQNSPW
ncbi:MAG: DUF2799 domain-containing protein [Pseudomonadota bacterium]